MARLKDRQKQIPNGFKFSQPEIGWSSRPWSSFQVVVDELIAARKSNPGYVRKYGWNTDPEQVAVEVEAFNVAVCQKMGWTDYIATTGREVDRPMATPKSMALPPAVANVVGGVKALSEWDISGEVVDEEEANNRAVTCLDCPQNDFKSTLLDYFTEAGAYLIKKDLERKNKRKLTTPLDDKLGVCRACDCPIPLKVWCPIDIAKKHVSPKAKAKLDRRCWILK